MERFKPLIAEYGEKAVEYACIAINYAYDSSGKRVLIPATPERVRGVLEAIYGRMGVNEVRVNGS